MSQDLTHLFGNFYRGKRVLVTGHTGFKGSWLVRWLQAIGASVSGFSLGEVSQPSHFSALELDRTLDHHLGDIRHFETLSSLFKSLAPEVVFHLAAQPIVRSSLTDPKTTFDTNLGGTVNVLEGISNTPSVRVAVMITSDKCYENKEWEFGYRETDRLGGKDPYSASKACAELAIQAYCRTIFSAKRDLCVLSTRAGNVIGGGDWAADRIVPDCARSWEKGEVAFLRNPEATRPWQHVLEPLSGYLWAGALGGMGKSGIHTEAFNFGPDADQAQSVFALVTELSRKWPGTQLQCENRPDGAKQEATLLKLSCDKALSRLGWKPTLRFEEGVAFTADWYRRFSLKTSAEQLTMSQILAYVEMAKERNLAWAKSL